MLDRGRGALAREEALCLLNEAAARAHADLETENNAPFSFLVSRRVLPVFILVLRSLPPTSAYLPLRPLGEHNSRIRNLPVCFFCRAVRLDSGQ